MRKQLMEGCIWNRRDIIRYITGMMEIRKSIIVYLMVNMGGQFDPILPLPECLILYLVKVIIMGVCQVVAIQRMLDIIKPCIMNQQFSGVITFEQSLSIN